MDATALARLRGELSAATGRRRLDLILDQRDPGALVRALPGDELYFTIREIGLGDAVELVQLASPAQFRTFLDLACWTGDHFEPRKALPWLRAARVGSLDSPRAEARWRAKLKALDVEVLHLAFRETLDIHDLEVESDPELGDRFMRTPEGKYIIDFRAEGAEYMAIRGIVDDMYAEDAFMATRLLASIRSDLPSELEESALRWRTARLADLGYPSVEEALSWFARPATRSSPPAGTPARPPGFYLERLGTGSLLSRAAARLPPYAQEHLELELVTAANASLIADRVDPGDLEAVRAAVATGRAFVEMGLEEAAGGDEEKATEILATTAVKSLFQRGFGRVLALKWRAERLFAAGGAGTREEPQLESPLGEMLSALARRRPLYFPGIERPREEWGTPMAGAFQPRGFLSFAEVSRTADALARAEELVLARSKDPSSDS